MDEPEWTPEDYDDLAKMPLAETEQGDLYLEVKPWPQAHAEQNPGHTTVETIDTPAYCKTCGAKSPGYQLLNYPREDAVSLEFAFTEDVLIALREALDTVRRMPPLPKRVEVLPHLYEGLKRKATEESEERDGLGLQPMPPWAMGLGHFGGIPVVVKDDVPPPGWKIVQREQTSSIVPGEDGWQIEGVPTTEAEPKVGDPCGRCGRPTSYSGEHGVVVTKSQIAHMRCPEDHL